MVLKPPLRGLGNAVVPQVAAAILLRLDGLWNTETRDYPV